MGESDREADSGELRGLSIRKSQTGENGQVLVSFLSAVIEDFWSFFGWYIFLARWSILLNAINCMYHGALINPRLSSGCVSQFQKCYSAFSSAISWRKLTMFSFALCRRRRQVRLRRLERLKEMISVLTASLQVSWLMCLRCSGACVTLSEQSNEQWLITRQLSHKSQACAQSIAGWQSNRSAFLWSFTNHRPLRNDVMWLGRSPFPTIRGSNFVWTFWCIGREGR